MADTKINHIINNETGENYFLHEVIYKTGIEKRNLLVESFEIIHLHKFPDCSIDFCTSSSTSIYSVETIWNNNIKFHIKGDIPFHANEFGKIKYGYKKQKKVAEYAKTNASIFIEAKKGFDVVRFDQMVDDQKTADCLEIIIQRLLFDHLPNNGNFPSLELFPSLMFVEYK